MAETGLTIGAVSRPCRGETENGDLWRVDWHGGACRVAVVDGLGHGREAAAVARLANESLAAHPELEPAGALHACHEALYGTRGAAIAIACIDPMAGSLRYAGIGNVEARLWRQEREQRPASYRGIVGSAMRTIRSFDLALGRDWLLVVHTDGVSARFELEMLAEFAARDAQGLAKAIVTRWAREQDDATVVVVCPPAALV